MLWLIGILVDLAVGAFIALLVLIIDPTNVRVALAEGIIGCVLMAALLGLYVRFRPRVVVLPRSAHDRLTKRATDAEAALAAATRLDSLNSASERPLVTAAPFEPRMIRGWVERVVLSDISTVAPVVRFSIHVVNVSPFMVLINAVDGSTRVNTKRGEPFQPTHDPKLQDDPPIRVASSGGEGEAWVRQSLTKDEAAQISDEIGNDDGLVTFILRPLRFVGESIGTDGERQGVTFTELLQREVYVIGPHEIAVGKPDQLMRFFTTFGDSTRYDSLGRPLPKQDDR